MRKEDATKKAWDWWHPVGYIIKNDMSKAKEMSKKSHLWNEYLAKQIDFYYVPLTAHNWQKWKKSIPDMSLPLNL